jgi:diacylglycerol kinase (ATP)
MVQQQTLCQPNTQGIAPTQNVEPVVTPAFVPDRSPTTPRPRTNAPYGRRSGEVDFVMVDKPFSLRGRLKSFAYALQGIGTILKSQHNAWIHCAGTLLVCVMGLLFGISSAEWCWLIPAVMVVWTAEALNTAFELLCDVASPQYHPLVKKAKDASAGAVLICAIGSTVVGLLVFGPHVVELVWGL